MGFGGRGRCFGRGFGAGVGMGMGYGGGWRRFGAWGGEAFSASTPEESLEALRQTARNLESELEVIRARIEAVRKE